MYQNGIQTKIGPLQRTKSLLRAKRRWLEPIAAGAMRECHRLPGDTPHIETVLRRWP